MSTKQLMDRLAILIALVPPLATVEAVVGQETTQPRGNVGVLPIGPGVGKEPSTEEIVGLTTLVSYHLEEAVEKLAEGDLKEFARAWTSTQKAYALLADSVAEGTAQIAAAEARLEIARARFVQPPPDSGSANPRIEEAAKALEEGERAVLSAISRLRTAFASASDESKPILLAQMQDMLEQVEALRGMRQEMARGQSVPGLEAEMIAKMQANLDQVQAGLSVQRQFLHAMGASCAALLTQSRSQVQTTLKLLRLKDSMPTQQVERVEQLQESMRRVQSIIRDQRKIQDEKLRTVLGGPTPPRIKPVDEKGVLQRVDAVLGIKTGTAPEAN